MSYSYMHTSDLLSAGSPYSFIVADPESVCASGDGLDMVRAGKLATFIISAPAARLCDFAVKIFGRIYMFFLDMFTI